MNVQFTRPMKAKAYDDSLKPLLNESMTILNCSSFFTFKIYRLFSTIMMKSEVFAHGEHIQFIV